VINTIGYSTKNPHLPNEWVSGNSLGRGVRGYGNLGRRWGGAEPKKVFFSDHFQLNVTFSF